MKRYEVNGPSSVFEDENGSLVDYEDYAALEQRLIESERYGRQTDITIDNMEMKLAQMAAENAGMDAFVDALLSIAWQGGSADGAEIQELALKHGLLRQEVYSADKHENQVDDPGNFEDGDPVYFRVETPATDAFLAEVRAQGVEMFAAYCGEENSVFVEAKAYYRSLPDAAYDFAAQLRKGVQS
nr:hypothetical protein [Enterobacter ludwigii]